MVVSPNLCRLHFYFPWTLKTVGRVGNPNAETRCAATVFGRGQVLARKLGYVKYFTCDLRHTLEFDQCQDEMVR